ncbi:MAG: hypothetical protein QM726_25495 [Chitinophagaceae bacterium]
MIEVFKTNIQERAQANSLIALLLHHFPGSKINIDLHDCDRVLRVEGRNVLPATVMTLVNQYGFLCMELE